MSAFAWVPRSIWIELFDQVISCHCVRCLPKQKAFWRKALVEDSVGTQNERSMKSKWELVERLSMASASEWLLEWVSCWAQWMPINPIASHFPCPLNSSASWERKAFVRKVASEARWMRNNRSTALLIMHSPKILSGNYSASTCSPSFPWLSFPDYSCRLCRLLASRRRPWQ